MRQRLQHRHRWPATLGLLPVDPLEQHRQLGLRQMDLAVLGLRPDEAAALQALGEQAQAIAAGPEQLDDIAAPATKDKHVAAERIVGQCRLHLGGQTVEARAHVGEAGRDPDARTRRQAHHARRLWSTARRVLALTAPCTRTTASPITISMVPVSAGVAAWGA